jgi:hypothetical protein
MNTRRRAVLALAGSFGSGKPTHAYRVPLGESEPPRRAAREFNEGDRTGDLTSERPEPGGDAMR